MCALLVGLVIEYHIILNKLLCVGTTYNLPVATFLTGCFILYGVLNSVCRILERSKYSRNNHPNISTVGIVVSDWTYYKKVKQSQTALKSITFMTWDFGGQEEYYATHQCFLSRRSLYLVVWNVSHGMKGAEEIKPWLLNIQVGVVTTCIHV